MTQQCDLRLKFHRARVPTTDPLGITMLAGRALHKGIELAKQRGLTPEEAVERAVRALRNEIELATNGVRWDELEHNQDGSLSAKSLGKLDTLETAEWWLRRQLPEWLEFNRELHIRHSELKISVPFTSRDHWAHEWQLISYLDLVDDQDLIHDVKWTTEDFDAADLRKYAPQAHLYMAGFRRQYERVPAGFEFQVIVRGKEPLSWEEAHKQAVDEAMKVAKKDPDNAWTIEQIEARRTELLTPNKRTSGIYRHPVEWNPALINTYLNGMVKPRIEVIEAGAFAANPNGWWCSEKFCGYWRHCAFGSGDQL